MFQDGKFISKIPNYQKTLIETGISKSGFFSFKNRKLTQEDNPKELETEPEKIKLEIRETLGGKKRSLNKLE